MLNLRFEAQVIQRGLKMAAAISKIHQSYADYGSGAHPAGEPSGIGLWVRTLTAANLVAQQALHVALFNALKATTQGIETKEMTMISDVVIASGPATTPLSQRENKWLLRYHDASTGKKYTAEIPCADLTLLATNSEFMDTTLSAWTNLKTAFEAVVYSPDEANLTVLDSAQFVGRKL